MSISKINSYAKINLSLGVLGKLKNKLHRIESLVSFIDLHDEISIQQINKKKHKVFFYGRFSKNIPNKNTISKLLELLDRQNFLKNKKYLIKIKKNIPLKSGMGGGSMNASSVLRYFINKNKLLLNTSQISQMANKIGSDVMLGIEKKNLILQGNRKLFRSNKKIGLYTIIIKPNFGYSTEKIYKNIKSFSKPALNKNKNKLFSVSNIISLKNDLEKVAFKKYPFLANIKQNMLNLPKVKFVRMTGSGSSLLAYFNSKKASLNAAKLLKKKYKNYWCILSKTI
ncbi:MAG: 4-(cytidine 5'-diphospho)-2-C-methyl-D-erythritol kinase [Candidatus Pelagibacter sp.]|jgi:4-diphosphocytidyl-2-C-methyl-D-erythritol kinase|nr:MAG: 4-(cytidine 5'-diphospho)-2-C-methyl-D-erythritol kinase [Candidatus Pelagibacter sp.]HIC11474.1 4-(cytidine 5'-diphospho)-2-C-methyl-D-erythritol kinase [Candidatus Pelagibacter sp.]